jgi:hypothetical protein
VNDAAGARSGEKLLDGKGVHEIVFCASVDPSIAGTELFNNLSAVKNSEAVDIS